jgi:hypothetical protein
LHPEEVRFHRIFTPSGRENKQFSHQINAAFTIASRRAPRLAHRLKNRWRLPMTVVVKVPTSNIADAGKVRIGSMSPTLPSARTAPASVADTGKVRIGSMSPTLPATRVAPAEIADSGKVRIGSMSPTLPAVRTAPSSVADTRKVRIGSMSPSL